MNVGEKQKITVITWVTTSIVYISYQERGLESDILIDFLYTLIRRKQRLTRLIE